MLKEKQMNEKEEHKPLSDRHKKAVAAVSLLIFVIFCGTVAWFIGRPMIALIKQPETFRAWVDSHGFFGNIIFVGMMVLQVVIALIPGEPLEMGAGYAFGAIEGTVLCLVGTLLGSVLVFLLVRRFGVKLVEVFFSIEKVQNLKILKNKKRLNILVFFAFFLPGTPKDLLTYAGGLTKMPLKTFIIITTVARIPSIITSTVFGNAVNQQNYWVAAVIFGVTLLLSGAGLLIHNKFYSDSTTEEKEEK